jgi:hypothetical protein
MNKKPAAFVSCNCKTHHVLMRIAIIAFLILFNHGLFGQTFLRDYEKYKNEKLDSLRETRKAQGLTIATKWTKQYKENLNQQISQFDTVFSFYKKHHHFDFNSGDSIIIIYQTGIESDLSDFIIFNGTDTISYVESYKELKSQKHIKQIVYTPFLEPTQIKDLVIFDERDSLIILASNKNFTTAIRLAKENPVLDGASTTIIFAKKERGHYSMIECYLQPFGLLPVWRKKITTSNK